MGLSSANKEIVDLLTKKVRVLLQSSLPDGLFYHNLSHTLSVVSATEWLCGEEHVGDTSSFQLILAALFHDTGFIYSYDNHEEKSCLIAIDYMKDCAISRKTIAEVKELILTTKFPHKPINLKQRILCDADLDYLGREGFYRIGSRLRKELIYRHIIDSDINSWNRFQLRFLERHTYFTETALQLLAPVKQGYIREIKLDLEMADS